MDFSLTADQQAVCDAVLARVVKRYPLRRHGVPKDIVPLVLLLASDNSSYTTGQVVNVCGGYAMKDRR